VRTSPATTVLIAEQDKDEIQDKFKAVDEISALHMFASVFRRSGLGWVLERGQCELALATLFGKTAGRREMIRWRGDLRTSEVFSLMPAARAPPAPAVRLGSVNRFHDAPGVVVKVESSAPEDGRMATRTRDPMLVE
jgi:hypothetical protein